MAPRFGAAYVFKKPSGGWVSTSDASRLTAPDVLSEEFFGTSVAISGDTVVVGTGERFRVCVQQAGRWVGQTLRKDPN